MVGSSRRGERGGYADVLTLDMGGTSTDIALVSGGQPDILSEGRLDVYDLKAPMIDMTAVGAGGGSIAWLTGGGALRVGPKSAGSSPGPVAYGRGGTEPTLTDANLVLGRLGSTLAGGAVELDREAACAAVGEMIAAPLGLELEAAASGVLEIAAANISAGIRVVSVKRGRDPRRLRARRVRRRRATPRLPDRRRAQDRDRACASLTGSERGRGAARS